MTTIHRSGLTLTMRPGTWWVTEDGQWEVGRAHAIEHCDGPHPIRISRAMEAYARAHPHESESREILYALRIGKRGLYCHGESPHDREIGWSITDSHGRTPPRLDNVWQTRDEAIADLAQYLTQRETS